MPLIVPTDPYGVGAAVDDAALRKAAHAYCRQNFVGLKGINRMSGDVVIVSASGIKHSLWPARPPLIRSMALLPQIIEQASKTGEVPDKKGRPDIVRIHKYEVELADAGLALLAHFVVREMRDGSRNFYHLGFLAR